MTKIIGLNGRPLISKAEKNLQYLKLQVVKKKYEELRLMYLEDFNFQIKLLSDAERMNEERKKVGRTFLGWTDAHSDSLEILRKLKKYLEDNKEMWDYRYVDLIISKLPKTDDKKI